MNRRTFLAAFAAIPSRLESLRDNLKKRNTTAFLVLQHGRTLVEWGDAGDLRKTGEQMLNAGPQASRYRGAPMPPRTKDRFTPAPGRFGHSNFDGVWPSVPRDAFAKADEHQVLLVVPSLELVVVRIGGALSKEPFWTALYQQLFAPLMAALGDPAKPIEVPYPKSSVIRGVTFAPEVTRAAQDSDNWPLTWADDGAMYTSYGDGRGFEPFLPEKLSMGFARIDGGPADYRGINIRSSSGETKGDGKFGAKASGMLMVDGVLYAWARNTGNSQLMWSEDHGRTWQWGFKFTESFASPCFLNFGRNCAGAPDDYVYAYSQDGNSAYEISDGIVMARAPRQRMRERAAWESRPVFQFKEHCQRVDAIYHPVLKRYLLVVAYGHTGGWGIFEAPEPWGPWSVAFHTEYWGLGETHGYRIPTKWIAQDGHAFALVFSGLIYDTVVYDAFCVRQGRFEF